MQNPPACNRWRVSNRSTKEVIEMAEDILPRSDFYVYALFRHDTGAPFYIGKGKGNRWRRHYNTNRPGDSNKHKKSIMRNAEAAGAEIPCVKLAEGLTELEAFDLERIFIATLGRAQFGGLLANLTDGGDGESGKRYTPEIIAKLRAAKLGKKLTTEHKAKIGLAGRGRVKSPETCAKISAALIGSTRAPWTEDFRARYASFKNPGHTGYAHSPAVRKKISKGLSDYWSAKRRAAQNLRKETINVVPNAS
jgi:hypothetical protein